MQFETAQKKKYSGLRSIMGICTEPSNTPGEVRPFPFSLINSRASNTKTKAQESVSLCNLAYYWNWIAGLGILFQSWIWEFLMLLLKHIVKKDDYLILIINKD